MKSLGHALLHLASFIELADDSCIDPDSAINAIEQLIADLNAGDASSRQYLKGLMLQEIGSLPDGRSPRQQAKVDFYLDLMERLD